LVKFQDWVLEGNVEWVTWQREKGENGTPHLQGYFVTKKNVKSPNGFNMKWIKENINNKMHVEKRQGTHEQAVAYCNKKDTRVKGPWTLGEYKLLTESENREDIGARRKATAAEVLKTASEGATEVELWEKYPGHMSHYHKSVKSYMMAKTLGKRQQPKIVVLYGPPGTGKSHRATKMADAVGPAYRWQSSPSGAVWFDGYDPINHKVVILDDFKGGMPYTMLLRLLDRYPMHVEGKGFCVPFNPEWIIITSNHPPNEWYFQNGEKKFHSTTGVPGETTFAEKTMDCSALLRRLEAPYGKTIKMEEKYEEPAPEFVIADEIAKLESAIDLTQDDDDDEPPPSFEYEETDENEFCDETEFPVTEDYDSDDELKNWCKHKVEDGREMCDNCEEHAIQGGLKHKLKRTLSFHKTPEAELVVEKPPSLASAGHFKKVGTGPVQSLLRLKRARDDDEDVDDK